MSRHLAIDIGASGGKSFIGEFNDDGFNLREIHRFANAPVEMDGRLRWDIEKISRSIDQSIVRANDEFPGSIDSMAVDTWGVDYGLLNPAGELLENPVAYREPFVSSTVEEVLTLIPPQELFKRTGIQHLPFNTIFQLHAATNDPNEPIGNACTMLLMPSLLTCARTGTLKVDDTIASTTQLIDIKTGDWAFDIIEQLGIPKGIFPEIVRAGTQLGIAEFRINGTQKISIPVIHTAGHDTASAIAAFDMDEDDVYISSGSWMLAGCLSDKPLVTPDAYSAGLTNERAADGRYRILKNVTGLYLMQECQRTWRESGEESDTSELVEMARKVKSFGALINPDDPSLATPGDMPSKLAQLLRQSDQRAPESHGELLRCIFESIAIKCAIVLERITGAVGITPGKLQIGGGGAKNELLCGMIAGASGLKTIAGPFDATAIGNIIVQAASVGGIESISDGAKIVGKSLQMKTFDPSESSDWNDAKKRYMELYE